MIVFFMEKEQCSPFALLPTAPVFIANVILFGQNATFKVVLDKQTSFLK